MKWNEYKEIAHIHLPDQEGEFVMVKPMKKEVVRYSNYLYLAKKHTVINYGYISFLIADNITEEIEAIKDPFVILDQSSFEKIKEEEYSKAFNNWGFKELFYNHLDIPGLMLETVSKEDKDELFQIFKEKANLETKYINLPIKTDSEVIEFLEDFSLSDEF
jgi:hypothetical protein